MFIFGNTQSDPNRGAIEEALTDFHDAVARFNQQPGFVESLLQSEVLGVVTDLVPGLQAVGTVLDLAQLGFSLFEDDPVEEFEKAKKAVIATHKELLDTVSCFCETELGEQLCDVSSADLCAVLGADLSTELRRADRELKRVEVAKSKAITPDTARKIAKAVPKGVSLMQKAAPNGVPTQSGRQA